MRRFISCAAQLGEGHDEELIERSDDAFMKQADTRSTRTVVLPVRRPRLRSTRARVGWPPLPGTGRVWGLAHATSKVEAMAVASMAKEKERRQAFARRGRTGSCANGSGERR